MEALQAARSHLAGSFLPPLHQGKSEDGDEDDEDACHGHACGVRFSSDAYVGCVFGMMQTGCEETYAMLQAAEGLRRRRGGGAKYLAHLVRMRTTAADTRAYAEKLMD